MKKGFTFTEEDPDYVIVSFDRKFNYRKLKKAALLIQNGSNFVASNPDHALSTEEGLVPGTGSIVAAIATATGISPKIIGKPEPIIFQIALKKMMLKNHETLAIGDNIETDIPAGIQAGLTTVLMLTGVPLKKNKAKFKPHYIAKNYQELKKIIEKIG